jgi:hypothetical protein
LSNLYLSSGVFLHVSEPDSTLERGTPPTALDADATGGSAERRAGKGANGGPPLPHTRQIISGPRTSEGRYEAAGEDRWRVVDEDSAAAELGKRAVYLKGVTVGLSSFSL